MTTIRQLITDSFRESGILAVGVVPDAEEHEEGLRQIRRLFRSLFGNELGVPLTSVNFGNNGLVNSYAVAEDESPSLSSVYVPANIRLICNAEADETLYLLPNPQDGARLAVIDNAQNFASNSITLNGNGRRIESATSVVLNTNGLNREWFYRADLGEWVRITDLEADDASPLPEEFDDLLTTLLAFRLNPRYGAETGPNLEMVKNSMKSKFRARYKQTVEMHLDDALIFLPSAGNRFQFTPDFNRG